MINRLLPGVDGICSAVRVRDLSQSIGVALTCMHKPPHVIDCSTLGESVLWPF